MHQFVEFQDFDDLEKYIAKNMLTREEFQETVAAINDKLLILEQKVK